METKTVDEMLVECGWSEVAREAFQKCSASAPATLKACWPAHYICLVDPRGTIVKNGKLAEGTRLRRTRRC
jgi:hypothetical protein